MRIYIATPVDRVKFEAFVNGHVLGNLWQSWKWGEFQAAVRGRGAFWPILVEDDSLNVRGSALIVRQALPFKKCWFLCMYGPLIEPGTKVWDEFMGFVKRLAAREGAVYLRVEPGWEDQGDPRLRGDDRVRGNDRGRGNDRKKAHARYAPEWTLLIDLTPPEEEILAQMKPKGRYNIRLAEKKGVSVASETGKKALEKGFVRDFYDLLSETTLRDGFAGHNSSYYERMLEALGDSAEVFVARHEGDVLAAIIVTYFKETATYYYGASSNHKRELMAPYLLQWHAMQAAGKRGCKVYDLFGIAPMHVIASAAKQSHHLSLRAKRSNPVVKPYDHGIASSPCGLLAMTGGASPPRRVVMTSSDVQHHKNHPWAGVTEFKLKFGGRVGHYAPAQELVFRSGLYFAMKAVKRFR